MQMSLVCAIIGVSDIAYEVFILLKIIDIEKEKYGL